MVAPTSVKRCSGTRTLRVDVLVHVGTDPLDPSSLDIPPSAVTAGATALLLLRLEYALPNGVLLGLPGLRVGRLCRLEFIATYTTETDLDDALNPAAGTLSGVFRMEIGAARRAAPPARVGLDSPPHR